MKQETLEEAAEKYINSKNPQWTPYHRQSFKDGAKWMQKRMFSKEEVIAIVRKSIATGLTAEYLILALKGGEQ